MSGQHEVAKRRIDYTQEELAKQINMSKSTIGNRMKEIVEYYDFEADAFHKEEGGNPRKFLPPEYTPLLKIIMQEHKNNPASKKAGRENIDANMVIEYNSAVQESISASEELPDEYREMLIQQPWYDVSKTMVKYLPILVDELSELIFNLLSSSGSDLGQTIRYLCREIDKMNYCLERGNYIQATIPKVVSIDNGLMLVVKSMMENLGIQQYQDQLAKRPSEYLDEEKRNNLEKEIKETDSDISDEELQIRANAIERKRYLKDNMEAILYCINASNALRGTRFTVETGKKWKPIREQIKEGSFREADTFASDIERAKAEQMPIWRSSPEQEKEICDGFLSREEIVKQQTENLHKIVNRMVGQVIVDYFARN